MGDGFIGKAHRPGFDPNTYMKSQKWWAYLETQLLAEDQEAEVGISLKLTGWPAS